MKAEAGVKTAEIAHARSKAADYLELTKPRISGMVLVTTLAGYYLAATGPMDPLRLTHTLIGTGLVGSGASAMNQVLERGHDALMRRTQNRPLPAGRLSFSESLIFSLALSIGGVAWLGMAINPLCAIVAALTLILYVGVYTPSKRMTFFNTMIGAIPGALPPLIGWSASADALTPAAWTLFAILFFWQLPHFWAIAWLHREDYAAAGFKMLSVEDPSGTKIALRIVGHSIALAAVSLTPTLWGLTGKFYFFVAFGLGLAFLAVGALAALKRTKFHARLLLVASVIYLPLLLAGMALFKV